MVIDPLPGGTLLCTGPFKRHRYSLLEMQAQQSGYTLVYRARDRRLGGDAVIKELAFAEAGRRDASGAMHAVGADERQKLRLLRDRFITEARMLSGALSGYLARVFDVWEERGTIYFAMDAATEGTLLSQWIRARQGGGQRAEWPEVRRLAESLLDAIDAIHRAGCVHGDLKPDNVVVTPRGYAFVIDYGNLRADFEITQALTGHPFTGTYAPFELENLEQVHQAGFHSDFYSWGMLVYGMLLPHHGQDGAPVSATERMGGDAYAHAADQLRQLGIPKNWAEVIHQCLAIDPGGRPRNADEMRIRLEESDEVAVDWQEVARQAQEEAEATRALALNVETQRNTTKEDLARARNELEQTRALVKRLKLAVIGLAVLVLLAMAGLAVVAAT